MGGISEPLAYIISLRRIENHRYEFTVVVEHGETDDKHAEACFVHDQSAMVQAMRGAADAIENGESTIFVEQ